MTETKPSIVVGCLRVAMGSIFLWAFVDKLFGLGFATTKEHAWLLGGSPTAGFLTFGTHGPFAHYFQLLAGKAVVDWLFMMGLCLLGLALVLGIGMRMTALSGSVLLGLMWLAALPPKNNPLVDEHVVYILVLWVLYATHAGRVFGVGAWWSKTRLVQRYSFLE